MGRVGRSYPRFEHPFKPPVELAEEAFQARVGAIIGVLCALGLIGWLLLR
jgi:hypothetical protein